tara:strand:- start:22600 stop:23163 length:564 start_codon:yes stop_codon:yes gene_type:complete
MSKKQKETAKELIGEHMDVMLRMELEPIDKENNLPALLEEQALIQGKIKDKADSIDFFSQNIKEREYLIDAEIEAHKDEIARLRNRKTALNNTSDYLNKVLLPMLIEELGDDNGVLETDTARYKLYETFGSVVIIDHNALPDDFIKTEIVQKVDKALLRKACMSLAKEGKDLPSGASITKVKRVKRS